MSWSHHIPKPSIPLKTIFCIYFTPLLHRSGAKNSHFLLKSRFFQVTKRVKIAYFDVDLLNRKMVGAKTLLKSRFLLILTLLKPRFHCIWGQFKQRKKDYEISQLKRRRKKKQKNQKWITRADEKEHVYFIILHH